MLRQKIKILPNSTGASLNIYFQSSNNLAGLSEDIDNLVTDQTNSSINNTSDQENVRFMPTTTFGLTVLFYSTGSTSYVSNVAPNEFASSAVTSANFLNSFYVYKIYDTPFENTQNLMYTGYLNGFNFNAYNSIYVWNNLFEYADIHIPNVYLNILSGNTFNLYMKFNFYSANSGHVYPFSGTTSTQTESDLYNTLTFTQSTKMYSVSSPFTFREIKPSPYVNVINDSVESVSIEKQVYPTGNTFTVTGTYVTN